MERVFNHTAHKALWDWLSEHPEKGKTEYPGWVIDQHLKGYCIAYMYKNNCLSCPFDAHICSDGLYEKWMNENNFFNRSKLAAQIRDLPVREGVKCI